MKLSLVFLAAVFAGCANSFELAEGASGAGSVASTVKPISIANSTIEIKPVYLEKQRLDFEGSYVRVLVNIPTVEIGVSSAESKSAWAKAGENLAKYFWDKKSSLAIVAKPVRLNSNVTLPFQKVFTATSDNGKPSTSELEPLVLTPYSTSVDENQMVLIDVSRSESVDSKVFQSTMDTLKIASTLVSGGLLSKLSAKDYSEEAEKVDKLVAALLASGTTSHFPFSFNPYKTDRLDVSVKNGGQSSALFSVAFQTTNTLIGSGKLSNIPVDPVDITKFELRFGNSPQTIRNAFATTGALLDPDTPEAMKKFCKQAPGDLAELGLNKYDRVAVMYAYLRNSLWNRNPKARPKDESEDDCVIATRDLSDIPQLQLQTRAQIDREEDELRKKRIESYRAQLWSKSLPLALQTRNADDWKSVLSGTVQISVTGAPLKLSDDESLEAGAGTDMSQDDATSVLLAANLTYKKGVLPCFTFDPATTGLTFTTGCVRTSTSPTTPLKVEFQIEPDFNPIKNPNAVPTIRGIRFISQ